jgi:hypothetical protein
VTDAGVEGASLASVAVGASGPLDTEDDGLGQPYTLWEKFLTHTDASSWLATSPARSARPM